MVLLRHGRTAHNAAGRIQGQVDTPLDEVGRAQAEALGAVLSAEAFDVLVTSDLSRAADTAAAVASHVGLPLAVDARLRETHYGQWQGLTGPEVETRWPTEYAAWRAGLGGPVGGETVTDVAARALPAVHEHLAGVGEGRALLLVTHGGTARALTGALTELDPGSWWRLAPLGNTCWTTLVEGVRGWRVERHNTGLGPLTGHPTGAR